MVAGLITMRILANKPTGITVLCICLVGRICEEFIQFGNKFLFATNQVY